MDEQTYLKRYYTKEEEFLDHYHNSGFAASQVVPEWTPNPEASDSSRQNTEYFRKSGQLSSLTFDGAAVRYNADGFAYVDISLTSSVRSVTVRVAGRGIGVKGTVIQDTATNTDNR